MTAKPKRSRKAAKASRARPRSGAGGAGLKLADLANVGPATLGDLYQLGIRTVAQLARQDAMRLYRSLCRRTGVRHDPCVIDVFMATIHQARGGKATAWWKFTAQRKRMMAGLGGAPTV